MYLVNICRMTGQFDQNLLKGPTFLCVFGFKLKDSLTDSLTHSLQHKIVNLAWILKLNLRYMTDC